MRRAIPTDGLQGAQGLWAWVTIVLGVSLAVLDGTIANVALPTIATDFNADPAFSIWIVNGYQLAIVVSLLPAASLGEIFGYRKVYIAGIVLFTVASFFCVIANSLEMLTVARIVQGVGAAGLMSLNTALIRYIAPRARFGAAIGFNSLIVATGATIGPSLAGAILSIASWPWLFAINLPLGLAAVATGIFSLPESDRAERRFDWTSAGLSAIAIGLIIIAIDSIGHSAPWSVVGAEVIASALASWLFYRRVAGTPDPLLPIDLLRLPVFSLSVGTSISSFVAQMLAIVSLPFLFQSVYGFSPLEVGIMMMPWPLATAIAAPLAGRLSDRHSPALLGGAGLGALGLGLVLLAILPAEPQLLDIAWRMALCGFGFGMFQSPNNKTLLTSAPKPRSGAASGMLSMARLSGQAVGAALAALILGRLGVTGATTSLWVAAGFSVLAAVISVTRLRLFDAVDG